MAPQTRTLLSGVAVAVVIAAVAIVPRLGGIETWKIVLGLVGFVLIVMSGRKDPAGR